MSAFPSEEEMKAHVNKPSHPLLSILFPVHRKKEGPEASVVQYREMGLGHLTTPVPNGFTLGITDSLKAKQAEKSIPLSLLA